MGFGPLVLGALALCLAVTARCAEPLSGTLKKIKETSSITLGYRESSIPFSYLDDQQRPIGYALEICYRVIDQIKKELNLPSLEVKLNPVTSATRIPLMANGTIDLECGSSTNNAERRRQVDFTNAHFLTASKFVAKKATGVATIDGLRGKSVASTSGTTNIKQLNELNASRKLGITIMPAKDHAEGFLMVETDRVAAFVMDDILLASLVANSKDPNAYLISQDALSLAEPYAIMLRRDDPQFKQLVDRATAAFFKSPDGPKLFRKWFQAPIPPKGIVLDVALDGVLKRIFENPSDSSDPKAY